MDKLTKNELEAQVHELTRNMEECKAELNEIHSIFDLLGIPRRARNTCPALTISSRFTLFLAQAKLKED